MSFGSELSRNAQVGSGSLGTCVVSYVRGMGLWRHWGTRVLQLGKSANGFGNKWGRRQIQYLITYIIQYLSPYGHPAEKPRRLVVY